MTHNTTNETNRIYFVDNLRIYLTALVILHHVAIGYGGHGGWSLYQSNYSSIDDFTVILLTLFTAFNQSYFMSILFIIAGYFTVQSYNKKGALLFIRGRCIRFLIPILIFLIFLEPLQLFFLNNGAYGVKIDYYTLFNNNLSSLLDSVGHLWFLFALLLFSIGYGILRLLNVTYLSNNNSPDVEAIFPSRRGIFTLIGVLALITFLVRLEFSIGDLEFLSFQFAHFTHYLFSFAVGVVAYHTQWHKSLTWERVKPFAITAILFVPTGLIFLLTLADFSSDNPFDPFIGGFTYQSFLYVLLESIALVCITISLVYLFQKKMNFQNKLLKEIALSCYTGYIIHPLVIIPLMIALLLVPLPPLIKFIIVSTFSLILIFFISFLIRQVPLAKRILG